MSFHRITTIGSIPPENSEAIASREMRSPSFSSWWISTRCADISRPSRRLASASATVRLAPASTSARSSACCIGASIPYRPSESAVCSA
jgi:hypothetical protein